MNRNLTFKLGAIALLILVLLVPLLMIDASSMIASNCVTVCWKTLPEAQATASNSAGR